MPRIITVEEKPDSLRIWRNGQLIVNFHDSGYLVAQQMYAPDILLSVLVEYPGLLEDFIKQLRLDGKLPTGPAPQSTPPAFPNGFASPADLEFYARTGKTFYERWQEVGEEMEALHSDPGPALSPLALPRYEKQKREPAPCALDLPEDECCHDPDDDCMYLGFPKKSREGQQQ